MARVAGHLLVLALLMSHQCHHEARMMSKVLPQEHSQLHSTEDKAWRLLTKKHNPSNYFTQEKLLKMSWNGHPTKDEIQSLKPPTATDSFRSPSAR